MRKAHNRIELDITYIVTEYTAGKSASVIGNELGVDKSVILRRLKEEGVTRRSSPQYGIDKGELFDLYVNQKLSSRTIAKKYGCSNNHIIKLLDRNGIPKRKNIDPNAFTSTERKAMYGNPLDKHPLWKGGITSLKEHTRTFTYEWRNKHLADANFICYVSGEHSHDLHVHHSKAFYLIRDESLAELGLDKRENVGDFTTDELIALGELIKVKHEDLRGYVIDAELHTLFHSLYGVDTTDEQLYEFKSRYLLGEFSEKAAIK